jgi:hypothetical protein
VVELVGSFVTMGRVPSSQTASVIWAHRETVFGALGDATRVVLNGALVQDSVSERDRR